jgi:serine/threonine-protein kinase
MSGRDPTPARFQQAPVAALMTPGGGGIPEPVLTPSESEDATAVRLRDTLIGSTLLGQFTLLQRIGAGGFGAVYLAEQIGLSRKAVVKIAHPALAADPVFHQRFQREAKVLASLDHHHLVKLYNFGELPSGQTFLVMEYGGDRTLSDEIRQLGQIPVDRSLRIIEQICDALTEAHERGIVHRDLKPANILIGRKNDDDWIKVVDVGIAKLLDKRGEMPERETLTAFGEIVGTPAYFSPEQARGLAVDARSDIYSLGVVLYEMLTGKLPIVAPTPVDYVRAHAVEMPTPLRDHGVDLPAPVEDLVYRSLEKDPAHRFQSAHEMREAIIATLHAMWQQPDPEPLTEELPPEPEPVVDIPRSRVPMVAVLMGVLLVSVAGLLYTLWPSAPPASAAHRPAAPSPAPVAAARPAAPVPTTPAAAVVAAAVPAPSTVPPGRLVARSPGAPLRLGVDGEAAPTENTEVILTHDRGQIVITASKGEWSLRADYERTSSGAILDLHAPSDTQIRRGEEVLGKSGSSGRIAVGAEPLRVVLVNGQGEELPLLFLYQPNAAK